MTTTKAVIYVRVSKDTEGSRSLDDQERDCRSLAASQGLDVVRVYREAPGTSAYQEQIRRPVFELMLDELEAGMVVISWSLDRVTRRGAEQAGPVLRTIAEAGAYLVTVTDGVDTTRDLSELNWSIRAALARDESFRISMRSRRGLASRRVAGRHHGRAPYGLRKVDGRLEPDPETFKVAREMADRVLSGESAYSVSMWLNEREIPTRTGKAWLPGTVVKILTAPSFAGYVGEHPRTRAGKYADRPTLWIGPDGEPVSVGEGVVTLTEHRKLLQLFAARTRQTASGRSGKRDYSTLLGGFLRCGLCGGSVVGSGTHPKGGSKTYACSKRLRQRTTCPGVFISVPNLDQWIGGVFINRLAALEPGEDPLLDSIAASWTRRHDPEAVAAIERAQEALTAADAALERLDDDRADGLLDRESYARQRKRLTERREAAVEGLRKLPSPQADLSPLLDPEILRPAWEEASRVRRRELLALAIDVVDIYPRGEGSKRGSFDPDRVAITWRE